MFLRNGYSLYIVVALMALCGVVLLLAGMPMFDKEHGLGPWFAFVPLGAVLLTHLTQRFFRPKSGT